MPFQARMATLKRGRLLVAGRGARRVSLIRFGLWFFMESQEV